MANVTFNDAAGKAGYISEIKLPGQLSAHVIKDAAARTVIDVLSGAIDSIETITAGAITLCGKTKTQLSDGETTAAVIVDGAKEIHGIPYADGDSYTPAVGDAFLYQAKEFIWDGNRWNEFGDLTGLNDFAYADTGTFTATPAGTVGVELATGSVEYSGSFTPSGEVSVALNSGDVTSTGTFTPEGTISVELSSSAGSTATIKNPTSRTVLSGITSGTLPSLTTSVSDEVLTLGWNAGAMPTGESCESISTSDVTVKTGDATYVVKSQTFKGTENQSVSVTGTAVTGLASATFTGQANQAVSVSGNGVTGVQSATFSGNSLSATVYPNA